MESLQNYVADHRIQSSEKIIGWEVLAKLYALQKDYTAEAQTFVDICNIEGIVFNDLSNAVRSLMDLFKQKKTEFKKEEMYVLLNDVAEKLHNRINNNEGVTTDIINLAWVYLHLEKKDRAKSLVEKALNRNPNHFHALNLARILKLQR